jgi:hypothetical protein
LHYLESNRDARNIWPGGDPPYIDDPLYMSIAEELRSAQDDEINAKPEGDPWEVIVPTELVYLQKDSNLPHFTS